MDTIDDFLLRLHAWARAQPLLHRLSIGTRLLLAAGFIPTGTVKLLGRRFTLMPPETSVGLFFEAMYQGGIYWRFLGASQIVASVLLLIPATRVVGALAFFGIILNIFLITVGYHFVGTGVITGLMLLASVFLVAWDYPRVRALFGADAPDLPLIPLRTHRLGSVERAVYVVGGSAGMYFFFGTRSLTPGRALIWPSFAIAAASVLIAAVLAIHAQLSDRRLRREASAAVPSPQAS